MPEVRAEIQERKGKSMSEFGPAFDRAQAAYDAQEAPDPRNCRDDGHAWKFRRAACIDGVYMREFVCLRCGKTATEDEI